MLQRSEDNYRNAQLNAYLDNLIEDDEPVIDLELAGCEQPDGSYAYECAECDRLLVVENPRAVFDPSEHVCKGGCHH